MDLVHQSSQYMGSHWFNYSVIKERGNKLGFDLTWLISMAYSTAIEYMDMTTTRSDSPLSELRFATGLANGSTNPTSFMCMTIILH